VKLASVSVDFRVLHMAEHTQRHITAVSTEHRKTRMFSLEQPFSTGGFPTPYGSARDHACVCLLLKMIAKLSISHIWSLQLTSKNNIGFITLFNHYNFLWLLTI
jgi:hypothetical protein